MEVVITFYCCTQDNNRCPHKNNCLRYKYASSNPNATLFEYACTEDNGYELWMEDNKRTVDDENKETE